jgi:hypothetical protein
MRWVVIGVAIAVLVLLVLGLAFSKDPALARKQQWSNFYYNNTYVSSELEAYACGQSTAYVDQETCLRSQGFNWEWERLVQSGGGDYRCVANIQTHINFDLEGCGSDRGGQGEIDQGYECVERYCSPNDMGGWSTLIAPSGSPATCFQQTDETACQAQNCLWIPNLPKPSLYPKCLIQYSSCADAVGSKASENTGTTCCYGQQCMCVCRYFTGGDRPFYNCPCYNQRRLYGIVESSEGVAKDEIAGCGFPVLKVNADGSIDNDFWSFFSRGFENLRQLMVGPVLNHQDANATLNVPESSSILNDAISGNYVDVVGGVNWGPSSN